MANSTEELWRVERATCEATGGCEHRADMGCDRDMRCRARYELQRARRPEPFNVPLFGDLEAVVTLEETPNVAARMVTVIMARPPIPNSRRTDRSVADQWIRVAGQEAINHAGVCRPHGCVCPNCEEFKRVRTRAVELFDAGYVDELGAAYVVAMDEITGGAANTLWARPREAATPKLPKTLKPKLDVERTASSTERETSWVSDRFGGLEL